MEFSRPEYWVAFPFSRGCSQPRNWTQVSHIAGGFFTSWATGQVQEYWSGYPFPSPVDLPNPGIELGSPALQVNFLPVELSGEPHVFERGYIFLTFEFMRTFWIPCLQWFSILWFYSLRCKCGTMQSFKIESTLCYFLTVWSSEPPFIYLWKKDTTDLVLSRYSMTYHRIEFECGFFEQTKHFIWGSKMFFKCSVTQE